jgi:hypothetical protein
VHHSLVTGASRLDFAFAVVIAMLNDLPRLCHEDGHFGEMLQTSKFVIP